MLNFLWTHELLFLSPIAEEVFKMVESEGLTKLLKHIEPTAQEGFSIFLHKKYKTLWFLQF